MSTRVGIIGGYLGSGKTTLVNRLLTGVLPGRTAVVINDFGSINIDADLIATSSDDTIELSNGCICCQINDDATRIMTALAKRDDLDNVLCEVSGVGDPGQLAQWMEFPGFAPGPVLVCADATAVRRLLSDEYVGDMVARQFEAADVVLLTKTDVSRPDEVEDAAEACTDAAPEAKLIVQDADDPDSTAAEALTPAAHIAGGTASEFLPFTDATEHASSHASTTVEFDGPVDLGHVILALNSPSTQLFRVKGIIMDKAGSWKEIQLAGGKLNIFDRNIDRHSRERSVMVLIAAGPEAERCVDEAAALLKGTNSVQ